MVSNVKPNDQLSEFERRAQTVLRESAEQLDGRTQSRLTQARHAALDAINQRRTMWYWLAPLSGATATAVIAAILLTHPLKHHSEQAATVADEFEIVTSEDSLDFYRDVEFYAWLDSILDEAPAEENGA